MAPKYKTGAEYDRMLQAQAEKSFWASTAEQLEGLLHHVLLNRSEIMEEWLKCQKNFNYNLEYCARIEQRIRDLKSGKASPLKTLPSL